MYPEDEFDMLAHFGERPFACVKCDYRCATNGELTAHKRTHTGERPNACDECDYHLRHVFISLDTFALIPACT